MPVEVHFRGPTLTVIEHGMVSAVLIPNGETNPRLAGGNKGKFDDGTDAEAHFARLLVLDADGRVVLRASLLHRQVTLSVQHGATDCVYQADGADLAGMESLAPAAAGSTPKLIDPDSPKYWQRVATWIHVEGGTMKPGKASKRGFQFSGSADLSKPDLDIPLPLDVIWTTNGDSALLSIQDVHGDEVASLVLNGNLRAFILNFDVTAPSADELEVIESKFDAKKPAKFNDDQDFRWLYELFELPANGWSSLLGEGKFPAPTIRENLTEAGTLPNPRGGFCLGAKLVRNAP